MKKKIFLIILIVLIVIISIILFFIYKKKKSNTIELFGNIEIRQVDLSFQVNGVIKEVYVEEGDYIKKGQLLAVLDNKDYIANYNKAYYQEKESFSQAQEAISKYKRNLPLCRENIVSKEECETLLNNKNTLEAKYKENIANKNYQKNQLDYTKLYAPQDGIISTRSQEKGARISAGQNVYVMNLTHPVWVRTYIKETDLGNIKFGSKARILTDTTDLKTDKKKEYKGQVGYISPVAEFTPKTVQTQDLRVDLVYRIRVYIEEVDEYLRQGMPVTIQFDLGNENE